MLDIDEATLEAMAAEHGRYPWSRAVFGQLLEGLDKLKPQAIVFDILFIEPHKGPRRRRQLSDPHRAADAERLFPHDAAAG